MSNPTRTPALQRRPTDVAAAWTSPLGRPERADLPSVLVIAAHPARRQAWARRLRTLQNARTLSEAPSVTEAGRGGAGGLTILDLLPGADGAVPGPSYVLVGTLRAAGHDRIVVAATEPRAEAVRAGLTAGSRGYLFLRERGPAAAPRPREGSGPGRGPDGGRRRPRRRPRRRRL